jgi:hypothetical protein
VTTKTTAVTAATTADTASKAAAQTACDAMRATGYGMPTAAPTAALQFERFPDGQFPDCRDNAGWTSYPTGSGRYQAKERWVYTLASCRQECLDSQATYGKDCAAIMVESPPSVTYLTQPDTADNYCWLFPTTPTGTNTLSGHTSYCIMADKRVVSK